MGPSMEDLTLKRCVKLDSVDNEAISREACVEILIWMEAVWKLWRGPFAENEIFRTDVDAKRMHGHVVV